MDRKLTKPLQFSISDHQDADVSVASVAGVLMEARNYSNPDGYDARGAAFPIPHAPVYLADVKDGCYIASGLTDNDGNFIFHNIPNGRYCIKVEHDNSTVCDRINQLAIDDEIEYLKIKAIISNRRMIARVIANSKENYRSPIEEGVRFKLASDYNGMLKLRVNMSLNSLKIEILDHTGWILFIRNFEDVSIGYETVLDLNHLEHGTYIIQVSGDNYTATKKLILQ